MSTAKRRCVHCMATGSSLTLTGSQGHELFCTELVSKLVCICPVKLAQQVIIVASPAEDFSPKSSAC